MMFRSLPSLLKSAVQSHTRIHHSWRLQHWIKLADSTTSCALGKKQLSNSVALRAEDIENKLLEQHLAGNQPETYATFHVNLIKKKKELLESPTRFRRITEREERSDIPPAPSRKLSTGKILVEHCGVSSMKGALDIVLYEQVFGLVQPQTVIEFGSLFGGSALCMANTLKLQRSNGHVYSVDLDHSLLDPRVKDLKPDNLTFIEGDMYKIDEVFPAEKLSSLPHPWVVIEDAHANSLGVLEYFHEFTKEGDYIIYDDTDPEAPVKNGMGWDNYPPYEPIGTGKLHALKEFMTKYDDFYRVDTYFTDMFGYNATNNWNGYVRRMK